MNKPRWSVRSLMGTVLVFACASAVYSAFLSRHIFLNPISASIFTVGFAAGLFLAADRRRAFLIGFGLTGWIFTVISFGIPYINRWYLLALNRVFFRFGLATWDGLGQPDAFIISFFWIEDALVGLVVAILGSMLGLSIHQATRQQGW